MTWILTQSGQQFDLLRPTASMIKPVDIAHALSRLCRFNGHTRAHYSVAQHSLIVASLVPPEHQLVALLHGATEAYIGDMTRPLKAVMPEYQYVENQIWLAVCERFDLPSCVKQADMVALATERRDLMPEHEAGALRVAAFLISYYGASNASACDAPAPTITTKDRLALVTVMVQGTPYVIVDICLRMLKPPELYKAQGFPTGYIISHGADGKPFTITQQVHMCGNSVSPPPMAALARANDPWRQALALKEAA